MIIVMLLCYFVIGVYVVGLIMLFATCASKTAQEKVEKKPKFNPPKQECFKSEPKPNTPPKKIVPNPEEARKRWEMKMKVAREVEREIQEEKEAKNFSLPQWLSNNEAIIEEILDAGLKGLQKEIEIPLDDRDKQKKVLQYLKENEYVGEIKETEDKIIIRTGRKPPSPIFMKFGVSKEKYEKLVGYEVDDNGERIRDEIYDYEPEYYVEDFSNAESDNNEKKSDWQVKEIPFIGNLEEDEEEKPYDPWRWYDEMYFFDVFDRFKD